MAKITAAKLLRTAVQEAGQAHGMTYDQFHDWLLSSVLVDCFASSVSAICVSALKEIRKDTIKVTQGENFKFYRQETMDKLKPGETDPRD